MWGCRRGRSACVPLSPCPCTASTHGLSSLSRVSWEPVLAWRALKKEAQEEVSVGSEKHAPLGFNARPGRGGQVTATSFHRKFLQQSWFVTAPVCHLLNPHSLPEGHASPPGGDTEAGSMGTQGCHVLIADRQGDMAPVLNPVVSPKHRFKS